MYMIRLIFLQPVTPTILRLDGNALLLYITQDASGSLLLALGVPVLLVMLVELLLLLFTSLQVILNLLGLGNVCP